MTFYELYERMKKAEKAEVRVEVELADGRVVRDEYEISPWSGTICISGMVVPVSEVKVWLKRMWGSKIKEVQVEKV